MEVYGYLTVDAREHTVAVKNALFYCLILTG